MAVMNRGDIILGHKPEIGAGASVTATRWAGGVASPGRTATAGTGKPGSDKPKDRPKDNPKTDGPGTDWPKFCGAMTEQQGDTTAQSTPQKFVRLVGYRNPATKPVRR
jgi:hypothetical protein